MVDLLPCPFCGGTDIDSGMRDRDGNQSPVCKGCRALASSQEHWNTRTSLDGAAISDAVVEAAARAMWNTLDGADWDAEDDNIHRVVLQQARHALTAALPHLRTSSDGTPHARERVEIERLKMRNRLVEGQIVLSQEDNAKLVARITELETQDADSRVKAAFTAGVVAAVEETERTWPEADELIDALRAIIDAARTADGAHPDDLAVDQFAQAMKAKMADSRAKGRNGWQTCPDDYLLNMLREHIDKGDMRDVANLAMMLWHNRTPAADGESNGDH
jgi:hypothetical protein